MRSVLALDQAGIDGGRERRMGFMLHHFGNQSLQSSLDAFFIALGTHAHALRAVILVLDQNAQLDS